MFDPNSDRATVAEDVYFLDVNPRYFSVILEWHRHRMLMVRLFRNLMVSPGIDLDQLRVIADHFGLQTLVEKIKERKNKI